ncbi:MAG: hypothetical protein IJ571_06215 [Ruminococcus sp.]|nr:hypothetical protein [Ruminococcus sp.]
MYTLDIKRKRTLKNALGNTFAAVFTAVFGAVYEIFSHEVYSYFMIYAFAIPLIMGAMPYLLLGLLNAEQPTRLTINTYNSSIAAFTVGCVFKGMLDIYGTTNKLIVIYPVLGGLLLIFSVVCFVLSRKNSRAAILQ